MPTEKTTQTLKVKEAPSTAVPSQEATLSKPAPPSISAEIRQPSGFSETIKPFTPDALANGFSTLVGALVGAMLAYVLQRRFQRTIEHQSALVTAHKIMFALLQQINTIVLIQRDHVFPELKNKRRCLSIPALPPFDTNKNVLALTELTFLLDDEEGIAILYDLYIAQENYLEALNQWNIRSVLHHEKAQPAMATSGINSGDLVSEEEVRAALGPYVFDSLVNATDNSIEALRLAFSKLWQTKNRARRYFVKRFKTKQFTDFDFTDTYGLTEDPADAMQKFA